MEAAVESELQDLSGKRSIQTGLSWKETDYLTGKVVWCDRRDEEWSDKPTATLLRRLTWQKEVCIEEPGERQKSGGFGFPSGMGVCCKGKKGGL